MNQTIFFHHIEKLKISKSEILADGCYTTKILVDPDKEESLEIVFTSKAPLKIEKND